VYQDRQQAIIALMGTYWALVNANAARHADTEWDSTDAFHSVWEQMCKAVVGGTAPTTLGAWPTGQYDDLDGHRIDRGLRLIPDFVRLADDHLIVFDAKFYNAGKPPPTHDVLKQLAYGFYLSAEWSSQGHPVDRVRHVFLMPYMSSRRPGDDVRVVGRHRVTPARSSAMAADIWLIQLDYPALAQRYLRGEQLHARDLLSFIQRAAGGSA
jgi:hypothetical protein